MLLALLVTQTLGCATLVRAEGAAKLPAAIGLEPRVAAEHGYIGVSGCVNEIIDSIKMHPWCDGRVGVVSVGPAPRTDVPALQFVETGIPLEGPDQYAMLSPPQPDLELQWFDFLFHGKLKPAALANRVNYKVTNTDLWKDAPSVAQMSNTRVRMGVGVSRPFLEPTEISGLITGRIEGEVELFEQTPRGERTQIARMHFTKGRADRLVSYLLRGNDRLVVVAHGTGYLELPVFVSR